MIHTDLGSEWTKEFDKNGDLVYYNHTTEKPQKSHPMIKKFRIIFNDFLEAKDSIKMKDKKWATTNKDP